MTLKTIIGGATHELVFVQIVRSKFRGHAVNYVHIALVVLLNCTFCRNGRAQKEIEKNVKHNKCRQTKWIHKCKVANYLSYDLYGNIRIA